MAKDKNDSKTQDMLGFDTRVIGLGIVDVKIAKGDITAVVRGVTEAQDLAQITQQTWHEALAEWLVNLTSNDGELIGELIDAARNQYFQREQDQLAAKAALEVAEHMASKVSKFPSSAGAGLA